MKEDACYCGGQHVDVTIHKGAVPSSGVRLKGDKETAIVSASSRICKGEFVQRVLEYKRVGDKLRWGLEDVHILDAVELSSNRIGVVFAQAGETKFKLLALEGDLALGNTLVITEDEALESASLLELPDGRAMVAYNQDAAGMLAVIKMDGRTSTLEYMDLWDDRDPENICMCRLSNGRILISGMRQAPGNENETWVRVVTPGDSRITVGEEVRVDDNHDVDVYVNGWSMAQVGDNTAVLVYPKALDKPLGFAVIDVEGNATPVIRMTGEGKYASSLPAIQAVGLSNGRWMMVYGIGWLSADKRVVKSTLAMEVWGLTRYAAELIWYGCEGTRYAAGIGCVAAATNGLGAALTYTGDKEARVALLSLLDAPCPGPPVSVGFHDGFCRVVPISASQALLVSQVEGNGWVQEMDVAETVIPSETFVHGVAITGGAPGETITIQTPTNKESK